MELMYSCLVLDHDDTVVASTPTIHYPAFMKALKTLRPEIRWSLQEYMNYNFDPGFEPLCRDILQFTPEEEAFQEKIWRDAVVQMKPPMFPGMKELLTRFHNASGMICVVSHSSERVIAEDYRRFLGFEPDLIYGWERGEGHRKPESWPILQILKETNLEPEELLMVDDMKPGWIMANNCQVPFAFAGWGNPVQEAWSFMRKHTEYVFDRVEQLSDLIFSE